MGTIPVAKPSLIRKGWHPRRGLALAILVFGVLGLFGVALAFVWMDDEPDWVSAGSIDRLAIDQPMRPDGQQFWLVRTSEDEVTALVSRSPHLGCTIVWNADYTFIGQTGWLMDPCSGSVFDAHGVKAAGPAPRNMDTYQVQVVRGKVRVYTDQVICSDGAESCEPPKPR